MIIQTIAPKVALNKVFLKEPLQQTDIDAFKGQLMLLFDRLQTPKKESEEFYKNIIADFLKQSFYTPNYEINVKERKDLVIHAGKTTREPVAVLFETKQPNSREMISTTKPNQKALHQLILYYLEERIEHQNIAIQHLIVTDSFHWYIFDENVFDKHFYRNAAFQTGYKHYKQGKDTDFFYTQVAKPLLAQLEISLECTYFHLLDFQKTEEDTDLIALYKILSPVHLLKLPFANDSNQLDEPFYAELLHIMGLEEVKEGNKKVIQRKAKPDEFSLLENTITQLENRGLAEVPNLLQWGSHLNEQIFNIALELCLTWVNRILFLKLLEAQLIAYHRGSLDYAFLHPKIIYDYDRLNKLFFQVLAERTAFRTGKVKTEFEHVPYLNSSLFERTELERKTFEINYLEGSESISIFQNTVLKDEAGKRKTGTLTTLTYLLSFLEAYDFASEGKEKIQKQQRNLINASVLGLIFEKINGYKDGSFFTPGFITMYMCRETIRQAVVHKFKEAGFQANTFDELKSEISDRKQANFILNQIKICDPAVGSGHFLVSALNEMIVVKADLGVLLHRDGSRVRDFIFQIEKDELIVTDETSGDIFHYFVNNKGFPPQERQKLQETLFHEKQIMIENCLFGVDINPNSVKICRLRLWIELLKNAYYTPASGFKALETLPNIDINIKQGNSLVSKLNINDAYNNFDAARRQKIRNLVPIYKEQVDFYKSVKDKNTKIAIQQKIADCLATFHGLYNPNDKDYIAWKTKEAEYLRALHSLLKDDAEIEKRQYEVQNLEIIYINKTKILDNAFEWRFEFPEVLDAEGNFAGFDVIIGNPPYISGRDWNHLGSSESFKKYFQTHYKTATYQMDMYVLFIEKAFSISKNTAIISLIVPNAWLSNTYSESIRHFILTNSTRLTLTTTPTNTFKGLSVDTVLFNTIKNGIIDNSFKINKLVIGELIAAPVLELPFEHYSDGKKPISTAMDSSMNSLLAKIKLNTKELGELAEVTRGVHPYRIGGYGVSAFGTGYQTQKDVAERPYNSIKLVDGYRPFIYGKNLKSFEPIKNTEYIKYGKWLAEPREATFFEGERVYSRKILGERLVVTFVKDDSVADQQIYITKPKHGISAAYLTAVLGSKLMAFYIKNYFDEGKDAFPQIKVKQLKSLPIPFQPTNDTVEISTLVEQVLSLKKTSPSVSTADLESAIDSLVYGLYGLNAADITLIEG